MFPTILTPSDIQNIKILQVLWYSRYYLEFFLKLRFTPYKALRGTVTVRHGSKRKRSTKRLKHIGNMSRKNVLLKDVC